MQKMKALKQFSIFVGLTFGLTVTLAQEPVSEVDYEAAMQEMRYIVVDAAMHIDSSYWGDLGEDSDKFYTQLSKVESFWKARGQTQAAALANQALEAVSAISRASGAEDRGAATSALSDLRDTCSACHTEFREETPDGFRIKPSALQ